MRGPGYNSRILKCKPGFGVSPCNWELLLGRVVVLLFSDSGIHDRNDGVFALGSHATPPQKRSASRFLVSSPSCLLPGPLTVLAVNHEMIVSI